MTKHLSIYLVALSILLAACGQLDGSVLTFKSADPGVSVAFFLLPPPDVEVPPECVNAKANISATGERIYHLPGQANYNTVKIDKDGEAVYCTEQEAIDAGFRKAQR